MTQQTDLTSTNPQSPAADAATPVVATPAAPETLSIQPPTTQANSLTDPEFLSRLSQEYMSSGKLSDDTYKALEGLGVPRGVADDYIQSKTNAERYRTEATTTRVYAECGGKQQVDAALAWAQKNLSAASVQALNAQFASADPEVVVTAIRGLQARAGVSQAPAGFVPSRTGVAESKSYRSEAEFLADIRNPKFRTDPAFRAQVEAAARAGLAEGSLNTNGISYKGQ